MGKSLQLMYKAPLFWLSRIAGYPGLLPVNYTFSLTRRCNSRCKTCYIWDDEIKDEMSFDEWRSVISSLGRAPVWITLSGGEPFLVEWIDEVIREIAKVNRPELLVIPTNALLPDVIERRLSSALPYITKRDISQVTINVSLDGLGELHNSVRGIPGNFDRVIETLVRLKDLQREFPVLSIGVHTVVSRWNVHGLRDLIDFVREDISPDQHIFEVAEVRGEMNNNIDVPTPSREEFELFLSVLDRVNMDKGRKGWINRAIVIFRKRYYAFLKGILYEQKQALPSFAGFASVQINSNGDVWDCAVHTDVMGNLGHYDYDFKRFWKECDGVKAVQSKVKSSHLCPLANEMYINMLFSPWRLLG